MVTANASRVGKYSFGFLNQLRQLGRLSQLTVWSYCEASGRSSTAIVSSTFSAMSAMMPDTPRFGEK
jgi:hypothetical protein